MTDPTRGVPCHWTHDHGPHDWTPLVADLEQPRVLHLLGTAVRCPGTRCGACRDLSPEHTFGLGCEYRSP